MHWLQIKAASFAPVSAIPSLSAYAKTTDLPKAPTMTPASESPTPATGTPGMYATADHVHPRISETINGVLDANGTKTVTFARTYALQPSVSLLSVSGNGAIMWDITYILTNNLYTGCTIKAYRGQKLPAAIASLTALLGFDCFGGLVGSLGYTGFVIKSSLST